MTATLSRRNRTVAWALLSPALLLVGGLVLYPLYAVLATSLREGRSPNISRLNGLPIGLGNYARVLTDEVVWRAAGRTALLAAGVVGPAFLIGLALALLLDRDFPGRRIVRSLMLLPWAVPGVVAALAFLWMFNASYGVVNATLRNAGLIASDINWFGDERTALFSVMLPAVWKSFPFFVITLLAALQSIPSALYEAARMDGAGSLALFRYVTWPGIRGAARLAIALQALWIIKDFDLVFATTGGGPARATQTLSLLVYEEAFQYFRLGIASTIGILLLAGCFALAWFTMGGEEPSREERA